MTMLSKKTQVIERLGRNSKAWCRGGGARSSNEVAVMAMKQRDTIIQLENWEQLWEQEDLMKESKPYEWLN